jgi:hypothetical protein
MIYTPKIFSSEGEYVLAAIVGMFDEKKRRHWLNIGIRVGLRVRALKSEREIIHLHEPEHQT